eukprot:s1562_g5.t1
MRYLCKIVQEIPKGNRTWARLPCKKEAHRLKRGGVDMATGLRAAVLSLESQTQHKPENRQSAVAACDFNEVPWKCLGGRCLTEQMALSWCIISCCGSEKSRGRVRNLLSRPLKAWKPKQIACSRISKEEPKVAADYYIQKLQVIRQSDEGRLRVMLVPAPGSFGGRCWNERVGPFVVNRQVVFPMIAGAAVEDCDDDVPNMMLLQTHQVEPARGSIFLDKKDETDEILLKQEALVMAYAAWPRLGALILHHSFTKKIFCFDASC